MKTQTIHLDPKREEVTLSALLWESSPALQDASRPRPGLLILPGGGYQSHAHREADPIAVRFAAMGYHTWVLRYSLRPADDSCLYPQPLLDVARAMLYIRAHAGAWCLDASRVGICGFSAGGHAALLYAASWQRAWLQERFENPGEDLRPAVCIAGYPVVDYMAWPDERCEDPGQALLEATDPSRLVTGDMPPSFLWATAADRKVPAANTLHMAEALLQAGVPVETHMFEAGEHGLALACSASAGIRRKVEPEAARWVELCEAWLSKRFALTLMDE